MHAEKPPASLRAVLDTNVYVSAFTRPGGTPYEIWQAAILGRYRLVTSPAIVRELACVLRKDFEWEEAKLVSTLKVIARAARVVTPSFVLNAVPADPDDNRVLECAVAGHANVIVSGDRDLTLLRSYEGIAIVRPADFRRILGV